jgi:very-short-patch-repair endonuclease
MNNDDPDVLDMSPKELKEEQVTDSKNPSPIYGRGAGERVVRQVRAYRAKRISVNHAKQLRTYQTEAELRLWYYLRAHRFLGLKFKRQKPIGPYIVDFVCLEHRLVIEVDGGQHSEHPQRDMRRDKYLKNAGLTVLRFWNHEVLKATDVVLEAIRLEIEKHPSPLAPLPPAGEGNIRT